MFRFIALSFALALTVSTSFAQEGVLSRTGRALDNAGRGIRNAVDNRGIAEGPDGRRGAGSAQPRDPTPGMG